VRRPKERAVGARERSGGGAQLRAAHNHLISAQQQRQWLEAKRDWASHQGGVARAPVCDESTLPRYDSGGDSMPRRGGGRFGCGVLLALAAVVTAVPQ
jgi:hypothetical protein